MSRLVMLPNARHVPAFPPVSSWHDVSTCRVAYRACKEQGKLRIKGLEADYLPAVRGIITGPRLVAPKQRSSYASGHRLGGQRRPTTRFPDLCGTTGGRDSTLHATAVWSSGLTCTSDRADLEEIGKLEGVRKTWRQSS
jgi:hypothetical protein